MDSSPPEEPSTAPASVTIVIPAHNEEGAIGDVIARLRAQKPANVVEIIVVDDGSTDRTADIAEAAGVRVLRHGGNRGYGAALKTGIREATTDYILTMDADGQHRLEDVLSLCNAVTAARPPDCVIGHRVQLLHSPLWRMPGKWLLTRMAQFLTQKKIPDLNSGLRIVKRDVFLRYIHLCPSGFSFSTTITVALLSRGYAVKFLPIQVEKRIGKSLVSMKTGFQAILLLFRLIALFNPLRIFLPSAFVSIVFGVSWTIPYLLRGEGVTVASMLAILTGVLLFALGLICDQVAQLRLERYE
ncbi:MAG: glycosyltransferase family 2 protein [Deltaproteobacteria bacterium]|nr:glycosyltransferase family 2 protein [Deltaproteobacteria bacterium]MCW5806586.1 glycosyltransferase family 2 protein [Deltaproteobacteria bacterium]